MGVAGTNRQWGHFVAPVLVKRGRALHLIYYEALGDFRAPVRMIVEVVLNVGKGAKFGVQKVNSGQNACNRYASVGMGRILKIKLSPLRVNYLTNHFLIFPLI